MKKTLFSLLACATLGLTVASCGGDGATQNGAHSFQLAPRKGLSNNYVTCNISEGDITRIDGWLVAKDRQTFTADGVFDPELNVRFDSLRLSRFTRKDGTLVVGYLRGHLKSEPLVADELVITPEGKVEHPGFEGNFVTKVEPGKFVYYGCATQREVKRRGAQGGTIFSTKNVIDTTYVGAHLFPNGDLYVGKMSGDLGTDMPDFLEGYYETTAGEVYALPAEYDVVKALVKKAVKAKQLDANAKWAKLLNTKENLDELYGKVEANYDTPPTIDGQPAATAPIKLEPYEIEGRPADNHTLTIRFLVQSDGRPTAIEVTDCKDPEAAGTAKALIRKLNIQPATKGGKPVKAWVKRSLTYQTVRN